MGRKMGRETSPGVGMVQGAAPLARIREDLEGRGVPAQFSDSVAARLVKIAGDLGDAEYEAVLEGVATAYGVYRDDETRSARVETREIHRLIQDFAVELKKLDEGLRILSAYLLRIRERTRNPRGGRLLH
jgi:hypothetical protein